MVKILYFLSALFFAFTPFADSTTTFDITHNLPDIAGTYPSCGGQLAINAASQCFIKFNKVIGWGGFDPTNRAHCCADWDTLACIRAISTSEPECLKNQTMRDFISKAIKQKEKENENSVCNPFKFNCPNAPKFGLEDEFPNCYAKVKTQLEWCKPRPTDFSQVKTNATQCCSYWAMITCERETILNEPNCAAAKDFANKDFKSKKEKSIDQVCNPYQFACKDAPDLHAKYPECFKKLQKKQEECMPPDHDFRSADTNPSQCCNYWEMVECTRRQAVVEPVCKESRGFIEVEFSPANTRLVAQYCSPKRFDCKNIKPNPRPDDPNRKLREQYPECFKKIDQKQAECQKRKDSDYSNAYNNAEHCCNFWDMIECTRTEVNKEVACESLKAFINNEYSPSNARLVKEYCPADKFDCRNRALRKQYPNCFEKIDAKQQLCKSKHGANYTNAAKNRDHCCGFWAMIGCTRSLVLMENDCNEIKSWINAEYNITNPRLIGQYCDTKKFKCSGAGSVVGQRETVIVLGVLGLVVQLIFML